MDEPQPPQREEPYVESERDRRIANIVLLVFLVALIGGGIWLANAMFEQRQLDDCVAQGRTNCAPRIEAPTR
jgi:cytoskeletal protein RodZ